MNYNADIVIVGAGPAGLAFSKTFDGTDLQVIVIDKCPRSELEDPPFDAREIALTHISRETMQKLGIWDHIPEEEIFRLKEANVINGKSDYKLNFPEPKRAKDGPTDRLGYFVSNNEIRRASWKAVKDMPNLTVINDRTVVDAKTDDEVARVTLDNGDIVTGKLLVCADSRFSRTRQMVGIPCDTHQFGRTVLCFRMSHELSNENSAYECFHYGRTLAMLPLTEHMTNMVITMDTQLIDRLINMSDAELESDIYNETKGRLGKLTMASTRHTYPLVGTHARRFYDNRVALIGDAAVGMHPVTAHGYNLGLMSVDLLGKAVLREHNRGGDIGSKRMLERYSARHMLNTRPLYHGTNAIVKLFTTENAPARILRKAVLRVSNNFPPVKFLISRQLTG